MSDCCLLYVDLYSLTRIGGRWTFIDSSSGKWYLFWFNKDTIEVLLIKPRYRMLMHLKKCRCVSQDVEIWIRHLLMEHLQTIAIYDRDRHAEEDHRQLRKIMNMPIFFDKSANKKSVTFLTMHCLMGYDYSKLNEDARWYRVRDDDQNLMLPWIWHHDRKWQKTLRQFYDKHRRLLIGFFSCPIEDLMAFLLPRDRAHHSIGLNGVSRQSIVFHTKDLLHLTAPSNKKLTFGMNRW